MCFPLQFIRIPCLSPQPLQKVNMGFVSKHTVFKLFIYQHSYQKLGPKNYPYPNSKSKTGPLNSQDFSQWHPLSHLFGGVCMLYSLCLQSQGMDWHVKPADCGQKQMVCITPQLVCTCPLSVSHGDFLAVMDCNLQG